MALKIISPVINAAGALMRYLRERQMNSLPHLNRFSTAKKGAVMQMDNSTIRNLELLQNIRDNTSKATLISVLDKTRTSMGSRLLKKWIKEPLLDSREITKRSTMRLTC